MKVYLTDTAMLKSLPEPLLTDDEIAKLRQREEWLGGDYGKSLIKHIHKRLLHYDKKWYAMTKLLVRYRGCSCAYEHLDFFVTAFNAVARRKCVTSTRYVKYVGESDSEEELTMELV